MQLSGIHHLTAVSADAPGNVRFYTRVLGMRLVKKTVNQDDTSAYHFFYADGKASPGSDLTFFDFKTLPEKHGNNTITRTAGILYHPVVKIKCYDRLSPSSPSSRSQATQRRTVRVLQPIAAAISSWVTQVRGRVSRSAQQRRMWQIRHQRRRFAL